MDSITVTDFTVEASPVDRRYTRRSAAHPRIYLDIAGETLLDNIVSGRWSRPHVAVKKAVMAQVLERIGLSGATVRWSQYAGCSCPCSPGYVVSGKGIYDWNDYSLTVTLAEPVTLTPQQQALADARFASLAADPTLPLAPLANTVLA